MPIHLRYWKSSPTLLHDMKVMSPETHCAFCSLACPCKKLVLHHCFSSLFQKLHLSPCVDTDPIRAAAIKIDMIDS